MKKILAESIPLSSLCIVLDFDGTVTQKIVQGRVVPSLISILYTEHLLDDDYSARASALRDIYYPIEINPDIADTEKYTYMEEWWHKHGELLIEKKVSLSHLKTAAQHELLIPRPGMKELFEFANEKQIPVVIFSASGVGVIPITYFLEKHGMNHGSIQIVSNRYNIGEHGEFISQIPPHIHSLNKNEYILSHFPNIQNTILEKTHILLFGDSLHDASMVLDKNHTKVFRVAFLSEINKDKESSLLPFFSELYDEILLGESGITHIVEQLKNPLKVGYTQSTV